MDNVIVGFAGSGGIADTEGNELSNGTKTVSAMDTVVPDAGSFDLTRVNDSTVAVRVAANERLTGLAVAITGPANDRLTMAEFTAVDGANTTFVSRGTDRVVYRATASGLSQFVVATASPRRAVGTNASTSDIKMSAETDTGSGDATSDADDAGDAQPTSPRTTRSRLHDRTSRSRT